MKDTMDDFKVDGILCRVDEPLGVSHTGSAPYCYNGDIIVEPDGTIQVVAFYKNISGGCCLKKRVFLGNM